ncbi:TonB-dependent siderophore receptor [Komagataeibacter oboediens]|uniref:TonB-dependent siderophore receptor n=1 Tax=Komagataeibacter oboediens TaxID=65958 RepID=UPI0019032924|nr:TonB-dependent siderophore receptor [Komagataeibacter oboediens]GCE81817.1 TonB-dependent siderophore receptor [Komagataeibacter oboediens]
MPLRRNVSVGADRKIIAAVLMTSSALASVAGTSGAFAQPMVSSAMTADQSKNFSIPAGSLAKTLTSFGAQSGKQVSVETSVIQGLSSPGVAGLMTAQQALTQLLAGTGLTYRLSGNVVTLVQASANITLGPVRVGGAVAHENPTGPGIGYVAHYTTAGTKTATPITEIPNSIYIITKQQMVDQQPQNVMQALRYTPGVYAEALGTAQNGAADNQNSNGGGFLQRGFSSMQFIDGLQTNSQSAGETAFLDRIEAVNGPASVMYGQTSPGGIIGMSLKKPTETPLHEASVGFGNWGRYEATIDISDKITKSGNLRYRLAAIGDTQGTQTKYVDYHRVGVLPSITWDVDKKTSLTLLGSYLYTPGNGTYRTGYPSHGTLLSGEYGRIARSTFLGEPDWNKTGDRTAMFEYLFTHKFNKYVSFEQTFRWEKSRMINETLSLDDQIDASNIERFPLQQNLSSTTVGMDARFIGKFNTGPVSHHWVVGSDFRKYDASFGYQFDYTNDESVINIYNPVYGGYTPCFGYTSNCKDFGGKSTFSRFQEGVYFQDQIKYRGLSILLGGRNDWVSNTNYVQTINGLNPTNGIKVTNSQHPYSNQSAFTWRAGLIYNFKFGLAPYFSYSTSFVPQTGFDAHGNTFSPMKGKQYEVGIKYQIPKTDVLLTGSVYHILENHYLITDPNNTNYSADAGKVTSKGFEFSAHANITKDLRAVASYSYTDARYSSTNLTRDVYDPTGNLDQTGAAVSEKGKYVENIPRNMFSIFLDYTPPTNILKGLGVNGGIRYVGFTYSDAVNSYKAPDYLLFDIGAHYDFGATVPALKGLRAQLAISNLTNKYYVTSCNTSSCYLGEGRRVYGNLSYSW